MTNKTDEVRAIELSRRLSTLVLALAKRSGMSQGAMADAMGYSRSSFCQMLNTSDASRLWRLTTLCSASRVLGVSVGELVTAAESDDEVGIFDVNEEGLHFSTFNTEPRSMERLRAIIWHVTKKGVRPQDLRFFELGCRRFVTDFKKGKLADVDALHLLQQAEEERSKEQDESVRLPLWAALAELYEGGGEG